MSLSLKYSGLAYFTAALSYGIFIFFVYINHPTFPPDTWTNYELSKTIFNDFYHINTYRQFHILSDYGNSQPPLFPFFMAVINQVSNIGIYSAVFISFFFGFATYYPLFLIAKHVCQNFHRSHLYASLIFLALFTNPSFIGEMQAGGNITVLVFFILILAALFLSKISWVIRASIMGFVAGLICLTRFDFTLTAIGLSLLILWRSKAHHLTAFLLYSLILLLTISPWIIYSITHFNTFYVSDNKLVALSSQPIYVLDFYYAGNMPLTLFNDFSGWLNRIIHNSFATLTSFSIFIFNHLRLTLFLSFIGVLVIIVWLAKEIWTIKKQPFFILLKLRNKLSYNVKNLALFALFMGIQLSGLILTGYYYDTRYYSPLIAVNLLFILLFADSVSHYLPIGFIRLLSITVMMFVGLLIGLKVQYFHEHLNTKIEFNTSYLQPIEYKEKLLCLQPSSRVLWFPQNSIYTDAFRFGALTGLKTFPSPTNWERLSLKNKKTFLSIYKITHVISKEKRRDLAKLSAFQRTKCSHVYKKMYTRRGNNLNF